MVIILLESFAPLMKHSVRSQKLAEKKRKAIDLLSSTAARGTEANEVDILSDEDEKGYIEYLPNPGEFLALVAANSTRPNPEVFVARLLRLSEEHKTAYLAKRGRTWPIQAQCREKLQGGCRCIDISYRCCLRVFEWGL